MPTTSVEIPRGFYGHSRGTLTQFGRGTSCFCFRQQRWFQGVSGSYIKNDVSGLAGVFAAALGAMSPDLPGRFVELKCDEV